MHMTWWVWLVVCVLALAAGYASFMMVTLHAKNKELVKLVRHQDGAISQVVKNAAG